MNELKEIALELLTKYSYAQTNCIWEKSFDIKDDEKALDNEIQEYKDRIECACNGTMYVDEKEIDLTSGEYDYEINE